MTRVLGAALSALVAATGLAAQAAPDPRVVRPERPTVATHAGTVAIGYLEIETGVELDRFSANSHSLIAPTVFKIGVGSRAQLSVYSPLVAPTNRSTGLGDFAAGIKWRLVDAAPLLGGFAILPGIKFPTGDEGSGRGTGTTDVSILAISSHVFGPVAVDLNAGYTRRGGDGTSAPRSATVWTASFGGPAIGQFGWVAEVFGFPGTGGPTGQAPTVALLAGPTLLTRAWWSLDAGVIVPLRGPQPHAFYLGTVYNAGRMWGR